MAVFNVQIGFLGVHVMGLESWSCKLPACQSLSELTADPLGEALQEGGGCTSADYMIT
jgi:hypothetical protein